MHGVADDQTRLVGMPARDLGKQIAEVHHLGQHGYVSSTFSMIVTVGTASGVAPRRENPMRRNALLQSSHVLIRRFDATS